MVLPVKTLLVRTSVPVLQDILVTIAKPTSTNVTVAHAFTAVLALMVSICTHVAVYLDTLV